jgi:hypothetical protein
MRSRTAGEFLTLMSWSGKQFRTSGEPYLECTEGNSRVGDRLCVVPDQRLGSDGRHEKKAEFPGLSVSISALSVVPAVPQAESMITNLRIVACKTTISTTCTVHDDDVSISNELLCSEDMQSQI